MTLYSRFVAVTAGGLRPHVSHSFVPQVLDGTTTGAYDGWCGPWVLWTSLESPPKWR